MDNSIIGNIKCIEEIDGKLYHRGIRIRLPSDYDYKSLSKPVTILIQPEIVETPPVGKYIHDMTLEDYRNGVKKVFDSYRFY